MLRVRYASLHALLIRGTVPWHSGAEAKNRTGYEAMQSLSIPDPMSQAIH